MDKNINGLRIIETARSFSKIDINSLIDEGYNIIVKKLEPLPDLFDRVFIFQHKQTKKIKILGTDLRKWINFDKSEHELLEEIIY